MFVTRTMILIAYELSGNISTEKANERIEGNDLINAKLILDNLMTSNITMKLDATFSMNEQEDA